MKGKKKSRNDFDDFPFHGSIDYGKPKKPRPPKGVIEEDIDVFFGEDSFHTEIALDQTPKAALCSPYIVPALMKFVQNLGGEAKVYLITPMGIFRTKTKLITVKIGEIKYKVPFTNKGLFFFFERKGKKFVISNLDPIDIHTDASFEECEEFANEIYNFTIKTFIRGKSFSIRFLRFGGMKFTNVENPNINWDDIILDKKIIEKFKLLTLGTLENIEKLISFGALPNRGILLFGTHGTGKSSLIKAMLTQIHGKYSVIFLNSQDIIKGRFDFIYEIVAELSPSIVIIEDIERLLAGPGSSGIIADLLATLDSYKGLKGVITIATSNHVDSIDLALRDRPGRFDSSILIPRPSNMQFKQILGLVAPNLKKEIMELHFDFEGLKLNGAHAKKIITDALQICVVKGRDPTKLTIEDIKGALEWISAEKAEYKRYEKREVDIYQ